MNQDELAKYAQSEGERFWVDAGNHWLNDRFDLKAGSRVIEVGGYLGNWTDYVARKYDCFVDTYEPVVDFWAHMAKRFSNRSKISVLNLAVGDFTGEANIAVMQEGSTFYTPGACEGPVVRVVDVDSMVRAAHSVDLLALNCEGGEYNIVDRLLSTGNIWRVNQLLVQFHVKYPDAFERRSGIRTALARTHSEVWAYPFMWELWKIHENGV